MARNQLFLPCGLWSKELRARGTQALLYGQWPGENIKAVASIPSFICLSVHSRVRNRKGTFFFFNHSLFISHRSPNSPRLNHRKYLAALLYVLVEGSSCFWVYFKLFQYSTILSLAAPGTRLSLDSLLLLLLNVHGSLRTSPRFFKDWMNWSESETRVSWFILNHCLAGEPRRSTRRTPNSVRTLIQRRCWAGVRRVSFWRFSSVLKNHPFSVMFLPLK